MERLNSLSLFVGTAKCDAKCSHCAGLPLRKYAPKEDGVIDEELIERTLRDCYFRGARYLSISSSAEPTLSPISVTKTLQLVDLCKQENIIFSPINLYSNGIRIGFDKKFCDEYLHLWKNLGLNALYITVHDIDEKKNAKIYGIDEYPPLDAIIRRIHDANLQIRANLVLSKNTIPSLEKFILTVDDLMRLKVDSISAWPIRTLDDKIDYENSPSKKELAAMQGWIEKSRYPIRLLHDEDNSLYSKGKKLTLFSDGTLSNTWCN